MDSSGAAIVLAAAALLVLLVVGSSCWGYYAELEAAEAQWKPLYVVEVADVRYQPEGSVSPEMLGAAVDRAFWALVEHGPWTEISLRFALEGLRVRVAATEEWALMDGRRVGGATSQTSKEIVVGPSLSALCHEMTHVAEHVLDGHMDDTHAAWGVRGLWDADRGYRRPE